LQPGGLLLNERKAIIYATVCRIPDDSEVPWHRVVNAKGEISARSPTGRDSESMQRLRLEAEGVCFDVNGRLRLADHAWTLMRE